MRDYRELETQFRADAVAYLGFTNECRGCRHTSVPLQYWRYGTFDDYLAALARKYEKEEHNAEEEEQFMEGLRRSEQEEEADLPF